MSSLSNSTARKYQNRSARCEMGFFRTCLSSRRYRRKPACKMRFHRTRVKMDGSRPWSDLPEGIVELIINKLHFPDQIRALAVCKNWRVCKGYVTCSDCLPWVVSYRRMYNSKSDEISFMCEIFDPYSRKVVSKVCMNACSGLLYILDSKHGWLLLGDEYTYLFLHNPFTNETISLPMSVDSRNMQATMNASPTSPRCGIFMLSIADDCCLNMDVYYLSMDDGGNGDVTSDEIDEMNGDEFIYSMLFMKGIIYYALFEDGDLNSYGLKDGSCELLTSGFPEPYESCVAMKDAWLMEINENLVMVRMDLERGICKWMIFRFDWSDMSWAVETSLKSCAIYVSGNLAFSAPLKNSHGEILEGCRLFYLNEIDDVAGGRGFKCYSLSEAGVTQIESNEYGWIKRSCDLSFFKPPYFGI